MILIITRCAARARSCSAYIPRSCARSCPENPSSFIATLLHAGNQIARAQACLRAAARTRSSRVKASTHGVRKEQKTWVRVLHARPLRAVFEIAKHRLRHIARGNATHDVGGCQCRAALGCVKNVIGGKRSRRLAEFKSERMRRTCITRRRRKRARLTPQTSCDSSPARLRQRYKQDGVFSRIRDDQLRFGTCKQRNAERVIE